ncbi:hypothetical protein HDV05_003782 [Chytridiales sp. JEL 0842]|nr:hypothetical protein HDV05_003782 [Chytridiales sp. JEL 0842]
MVNIDPKIGRVGRVGDNSKNRSNDIFKFGGTLSFNEEAERYRTNVAEQEKARQQRNREKEHNRVEFKRNWKEDIERNRWNRMVEDFARQEDQWKRRHETTKMGKNSVSYNPITLEYHRSNAGEKLAQEDAKAMYRTSMRAAHLYLKNNTFDPLKCQDIPRKLVADINIASDTSTPKTTSSNSLPGTAAAAEVSPSSHSKPIFLENVSSPSTANQPHQQQQPSDSQPKIYGRRASPPSHASSSAPLQTDLDVPKRLISVAAQTAQLVRSRLGPEAEKVLVAGSGKPLRLSSNPTKGETAEPEKRAGSGSTRNAANPFAGTQYSGGVVVEIDGKGGVEHNWSRHF